jgi:hypothetical protein
MLQAVRESFMGVYSAGPVSGRVEESHQPLDSRFVEG